MGRLDSFTMLNVPEYPFIALSKYGITFSSSSLKLLKEAEYVHSYLDRANRKFAIQPCDPDEAAVEFMKRTEGRSQRLVRWGNRDLLRTLSDLAGVDVRQGTVRVNGQYYDDEDLIIYDLTNTVRTGNLE